VCEADSVTNKECNSPFPRPVIVEGPSVRNATPDDIADHSRPRPSRHIPLVLKTRERGETMVAVLNVATFS